MTDQGREKRGVRLDKAMARRARMRGQREAHKRGLDVRRVKVNAACVFGWEAWHGDDPHNNLRESYSWGVDHACLGGVYGLVKLGSDQ